MSILKHIYTKKEHCNVSEEYEFFKPEKDELNYILKDTIKDCRKKFFHSFEYRCVNDIKFTNMGENEEKFLTICIGYMKIKSQFYGLKKQ